MHQWTVWWRRLLVTRYLKSNQMSRSQQGETQQLISQVETSSIVMTHGILIYLMRNVKQKMKINEPERQYENRTARFLI